MTTEATGAGRPRSANGRFMSSAEAAALVEHGAPDVADAGATKADAKRPVNETVKKADAKKAKKKADAKKAKKKADAKKAKKKADGKKAKKKADGKKAKKK